MNSTLTLQDPPTTPKPLQQSNSAPTSRLQKRSSAGRPMTSTSNLKGGVGTLASTPETKLNHVSQPGGLGHSSTQASEPAFGHGPFTFEYKDFENTPPAWLRRIPTLSSLKTGSSDPTLRAGSPSFSYSNGSSAPILPSFGHPTPNLPTRNKLVKRSSSQKLLSGGNTLNSSLRRPATSHQRSATLQQFQEEEDPSRFSLATSSIMPNESIKNEQSPDDSSRTWLPSFQSRVGRTARDGFSQRRSTGGISNTRNESIKTIVPDMTEVATLVMASSISPESSHPVPASGRASIISGLSRPFTPVGFGIMASAESDNIHEKAGDDTDLKSRHSFSLNEMFPSPSPATWKIPRTGSLRKRKPFIRDTGGRRVVSAPLPTNTRKPTSFPQGPGSLGRTPPNRHDAAYQTSTPMHRAESSTFNQPGSSSPLPPLNRLSAFDIDLPETVPPYPTSPQSENPTPFQRESSAHSSQSISSPLSPVVPKTRQHRFSSAPSEPGSTLLGSDNDNSRLISGDEDDLDARSETIYDSTRTGATGSSHSGKRRPPIDTIFDESPPPELPSQLKLTHLQDLPHHNRSFTESDSKTYQMVAEEQDVSTPVRASISCKEKVSPTPLHPTSDILLSPEGRSPSVSVPVDPKTNSHSPRNSDPSQDEDLWSFEHAEISHAEAVHIRNVSLNRQNSPLTASPTQSNAVDRRRESPPRDGPDKSVKSNIYQWSESPHTDRDSVHGDSPRPKTVHGRQGKEMRGSHLNGRRGPSAMHLRSQSVPVQKDMTGRRTHNKPSALDSWVLGNKVPSEDWDGDFEFEEVPRVGKPPSSDDPVRTSLPSGMLVPSNILERQASVHGQFGQVKELALLVEDLKRLQQQAARQGIMKGQSAELWKEAEGIINLATLDDEEQEIFPPHSPHSPNFDFDPFDEDSPSIRSRRKSLMSASREERLGTVDDSSPQHSLRPSRGAAGVETPPPSRPRKESSAKAKYVLENIHQQRIHYDAVLLDAPFAQKKLPFDTTSLKDLVTRAGVVTRALKEIVRRAENGPHAPETPEPRSSTPREPPYISQMFHQLPLSPIRNKSPRVTQSPKSPKSQGSGSFLGGNVASTDNEINGHIKMMTVV